MAKKSNTGIPKKGEIESVQELSQVRSILLGPLAADLKGMLATFELTLAKQSSAQAKAMEALNRKIDVLEQTILARLAETFRESSEQAPALKQDQVKALRVQTNEGLVEQTNESVKSSVASIKEMLKQHMEAKKIRKMDRKVLVKQLREMAESLEDV